MQQQQHDELGWLVVVDCAVAADGGKCDGDAGTSCMPCGFVCLEVKSKPGTRHCFMDDGWTTDEPCSATSECIDKISADFCCSNDLQTATTKQSYARCVSSNDVMCLQ